MYPEKWMEMNGETEAKYRMFETWRSNCKGTLKYSDFQKGSKVL
jgi:hypothetical protein